MALEALDPNIALVVIDLQKGIMSRPTAHPLAEVVAKASRLAAAFRAKSAPVVLVNVSPSGMQVPPDFTELVPELGAEDSDHRVTKRTWGAFTNTGLEDYLKGRGVTQVLVVGVATSIGVESTARHARELGFKVLTAPDAMTDASTEAHENSVTRIFPRLGATASSDEILALLETSAG